MVDRESPDDRDEGRSLGEGKGRGTREGLASSWQGPRAQA